MFRKTIVLVIAVAVVVLAPGAASAEWKHHHLPLQQDLQLGLTGGVRFSSETGGFDCQFTSRAKFLAQQTTGLAETFTPHPSSETTNCRGLGPSPFAKSMAWFHKSRTGRFTGMAKRCSQAFHGIPNKKKKQQKGSRSNR